MTRTELATLDATAQAELVRRGEVKPLELVEAAIERIERVNPELNAVVIERFERARAEAASPELPDGPFRGVPFVLKDLDATSAGDPFTAGTTFLKEAGYVAPEDALITRRFREAGLVQVGKAASPELGTKVTTESQAWGRTRNPWNPEHSTGGSSGGSAAAVAAGLVPIAHASDGGGSIRIPASECGLVGLKPSRGRVSIGPESGEKWAGMVAELVVSRSVRDTATALDVLGRPWPGDPYFAPPPVRPFAAEVGADPGRLRIGLLAADPRDEVPVRPDAVRAATETGRWLEALGHHVEPAHPEPLAEGEMAEHSITVIASWTAHNVAELGRHLGREIDPGELEIHNRTLVEAGRAVDAPRYLRAVEWLQAWTRRVAAWWAEGFDLLLTPTIPEPPPPLGDFDPTPEQPLRAMERSTAIIPFTVPWNVTGQPALSLPLHRNAEGLPTGVQLVAAYGREDVLLRVAAQLEAAHPWADARPRIHA